jgi:superoxide dismutase
MYSVKVLTNTNKHSKIIKKFKSYDKAKEFFNKKCEEKPGAGWFIYKED